MLLMKVNFKNSLHHIATLLTPVHCGLQGENNPAKMSDNRPSVSWTELLWLDLTFIACLCGES